MSEIGNYISIFPRRCGEVLAKYKQKAALDDREVTLLLMAASAAIIIPYERLVEKSGGLKQPVQDRTSNPDAADKLADLLQQPFFKPGLWPNADLEKSFWKGGILDELMQQYKDKKPQNTWKRPEEWLELKDPMPLEDNVPVCYILECLRNALAHGNIYTKPESSNLKQRKKIQHLVFATGDGRENVEPGCWCATDRKGNPYRFVQVSVSEFETFLQNWIAWLQTLKMDAGFVPEQEEIPLRIAS